MPSDIKLRYCTEITDECFLRKLSKAISKQARHAHASSPSQLQLTPTILLPTLASSQPTRSITMVWRSAGIFAEANARAATASFPTPLGGADLPLILLLDKSKPQWLSFVLFLSLHTKPRPCSAMVCNKTPFYTFFL
ncbi:TPA: hypothetical protein ACH3X1_009903 [Trebouxia sp. C0004]